MQGTIVQTTDTFTLPRTIENAMAQFDPCHEKWLYVHNARTAMRHRGIGVIAGIDTAKPNGYRAASFLILA